MSGVDLMDWFEKLTGFREHPGRIRSDLQVDGSRLASRVNGHSYRIGKLEVVSLRELRQRSGPRREGAAAKISSIVGDVRALHRDPAHGQALFQVASQFNLLEMSSPEITPDEGVTRYQSDPTQGPACAIAAGAATIYRNYFMDVDGQPGQTSARQVDCLRDMGCALGNEGSRLWTMRNGYALCTRQGLGEIRERLRTLDDGGVDELRGTLRIGLHWDVQVTDGAGDSQTVSQAFCSALPVAYSDVPAEEWEAFATLVLEGAYEATLLAAALNAERGASNRVFLTRVGGGAFGNKHEWIERALARALQRVRVPLDVLRVERR